MARNPISIKHIQIDKANQAVIIASAAGAAVLVFGLFIGYGLLKQQAHQTRVITEKEKAVAQLNENIEAKNQIVDAYRLFTTTELNAIGGSTDPSATGDKDGDNARIVLDALPSKYDFPALTTSIETLLNRNNFNLDGLVGVDDEIVQSENESLSNPTPVEIPLQVSLESISYSGAQQIISLMQSSIRPFHINRVQFSGSESVMSLVIDMKTYYQPEKSISITDKVVQ